MKAEGLPESVANIALEIIENPQTEVTGGETKALPKRWLSDDSESSCCNGIKPANI